MRWVVFRWAGWRDGKKGGGEVKNGFGSGVWCADAFTLHAPHSPFNSSLSPFSKVGVRCTDNVLALHAFPLFSLLRTPVELPDRDHLAFLSTTHHITFFLRKSTTRKLNIKETVKRGDIVHSCVNPGSLFSSERFYISKKGIFLRRLNLPRETRWQ